MFWIALGWECIHPGSIFCEKVFDFWPICLKFVLRGEDFSGTYLGGKLNCQEIHLTHFLPVWGVDEVRQIIRQASWKDLPYLSAVEAGASFWLLYELQTMQDTFCFYNTETF